MCLSRFSQQKALAHEELLYSQVELCIFYPIMISTFARNIEKTVIYWCFENKWKLAWVVAERTTSGNIGHSNPIPFRNF